MRSKAVKDAKHSFMASDESHGNVAIHVSIPEGLLYVSNPIQWQSMWFLRRIFHTAFTLEGRGYRRPSNCLTPLPQILCAVQQHPIPTHIQISTLGEDRQEYVVEKALRGLCVVFRARQSVVHEQAVVRE